MTIPDQSTVITSATRLVEPVGLALIAGGILTWLLDLRVVPFGLVGVGVLVVMTSVLNAGRQIRIGPAGIESTSVRVRWGDVNSFNVERGWVQQYVAVRPMLGPRVVLPAPRTLWFGQRARFDADVAQLDATSQANGGVVVHRTGRRNVTRGVALILGLSLLLLFDEPWYWVGLDEYAAPPNACTVLGAALTDQGRPVVTQAIAATRWPDWPASACQTANGIPVGLYLAERQMLTSGTGVARRTLTTLEREMPRYLRAMMPQNIDLGLEETSTHEFVATLRVANLLVRAGPTPSAASAMEVAYALERQLWRG